MDTMIRGPPGIFDKDSLVTWLELEAKSQRVAEETGAKEVETGLADYSFTKSHGKAHIEKARWGESTA